MIGKCFECEIEGDIDMHHVVPKSLGGTKMVPLCYKCHGLVHGRDFVKSRTLIRVGMNKAKAEGRNVGRLKGSGQTTEEFLNTKRSLEIIECLGRGLSIRNVAKESGYSIGTIQKVINSRKNLDL